MQRFYDMSAKVPGLPLPGLSARGGAPENGTAYEPYRNKDGHISEAPYNQPQYVATNARGRKKDSRGSKIVRFMSCLLAIVLAAAIVGMAVRIVLILESTATSRLMWPYGMMLKAWPPGGMLAVSTYLMLAAGSMAFLVNVILLMLLCVRRGDNGGSAFGSWFTLCIRAITTAALITAVVLDAVAQPNLRSWSCISKEFETDFNDNAIGFEPVCFDLTAGFAATIGLAALELLNVAFALWYRIQQRRVRTVRVFATAPRVYDKLDGAVPEDDELQLLDRRGQMHS